MIQQIKPAIECDLDDILDLQKRAYVSEAKIYNDFKIPPLTQTIEELKKEWERGVILKTVIGNKIVGSVRAYEKGNTCYIGRLIVDENYQNRGIGSALMHEIENRFAGIERYELFTGDKSERNLYLYHKLSYKIFKEEKVNNKLVIIYLEKKTHNKY